MVDGSPRRRKGIKCGSAIDMENNMDGTGRDMENMTMTVPNTAMTNTNMETIMTNTVMDGIGRDMENMTMTVPNTAMTNTVMDGTGRDMEKMENMTMTVPNTAVTNIGMENNMEGTGMDVTGVTGVDMGSMAMAVTNAVTNMEKTAMEANGADTENSMGTCMEMMDTMGTCMEMMDTKTMGTHMAMMDTKTMRSADMEMKVQVTFSGVIKNCNMALDRRNMLTRITSLDRRNMSIRITSLYRRNMSIRIFSMGRMDSLDSLGRCSISATIFNLDRYKMETRVWVRLIRGRLIKLVKTFVTRCIRSTRCIRLFRVQDGFSR